MKLAHVPYSLRILHCLAMPKGACFNSGGVAGAVKVCMGPLSLVHPLWPHLQSPAVVSSFGKWPAYTVSVSTPGTMLMWVFGTKLSGSREVEQGGWRGAVPRTKTSENTQRAFSGFWLWKVTDVVADVAAGCSTARELLLSGDTGENV